MSSRASAPVSKRRQHRVIEMGRKTHIGLRLIRVSMIAPIRESVKGKLSGGQAYLAKYPRLARATELARFTFTRMARQEPSRTLFVGL